MPLRSTFAAQCAIHKRNVGDSDPSATSSQTSCGIASNAAPSEVSGACNCILQSKTTVRTTTTVSNTAATTVITNASPTTIFVAVRTAIAATSESIASTSQLQATDTTVTTTPTITITTSTVTQTSCTPVNPSATFVLLLTGTGTNLDGTFAALGPESIDAGTSINEFATDLAHASVFTIGVGGTLLGATTALALSQSPAVANQGFSGPQDPATLLFNTQADVQAMRRTKTFATVIRGTLECSTVNLPFTLQNTFFVAGGVVYLGTGQMVEGGASPAPVTFIPCVPQAPS